MNENDKQAEPVQPGGAQGEPLFWYRPVGTDGGYEGPIHNGAIEEVRKKSGAWFGLYPRALAAAINEQLLEALKKIVECDANGLPVRTFQQREEIARAAIAEAEKAKGSNHD